MDASPYTVWNPVPMPAVAYFAELRALILSNPTSAKRMPKWRFRFDDDLVIELQPKDYPRQFFVGRALEGADITLDDFKKRQPGRYRMDFTLSPEGTDAAARSYRSAYLLAPDRAAFVREHQIPAPTGDEAWEFRPTSVCTFQRGIAPRDPLAFRARILETLHPDLFRAVRPARMLTHNCMICGKGLTDPVSRTRWIGPECAGRSGHVGIIPVVAGVHEQERAAAWVEARAPAGWAERQGWRDAEPLTIDAVPPR